MNEAVMGKQARVEADVFIAANASVIGDVRLAAGVSIWYGAVLRGDINFIEILEGSNIQDNAVVHVESSLPARIGRHVTVGHGAILHACVIEDECLIGMGAIVLDGAQIGRGSLIAAGSVVTPGTIIPPASLVMGSPGRVKRPLTAEEQAAMRENSQRYVELSRHYR